MFHLNWNFHAIIYSRILFYIPKIDGQNQENTSSELVYKYFLILSINIIFHFYFTLLSPGYYFFIRYTRLRYKSVPKGVYRKKKKREIRFNVI
jgi:hypothetical protein